MVRAETLFCPGSGSAGATRWDNFRLQGRGEREGREVSDYVSFLLSCDDPAADRGVKCEAPVFGVTTQLEALSQYISRHTKYQWTESRSQCQCQSSTINGVMFGQERNLFCLPWPPGSAEAQLESDTERDNITHHRSLYRLLNTIDTPQSYLCRLCDPVILVLCYN